MPPYDYKARLAGHKTFRINGVPFTIRKINPFLDFSGTTMPQIFTDFMSRRSPQGIDPISTQKMMDGMRLIIQAGIVKPPLVPIGKDSEKGNELGLTLDDILRDMSVAMRLYSEIMDHSLARFSGVKGLFFSIGRKLSEFMPWRRRMEKRLLKSYFQPENTP